MDGKKLFVIGQQRRFDLIGMDSKSQQFSVYLPGVSAGEVDIQRNGDWITYVVHPELTLWRSKMDGSSRTQLTYAPMQAHMPRWSPDGDPDRIHGVASGKTVEDLRDARRGRHAEGTDGRRPQPG